MHYFPIATPFLIGLGALFVFLIILIQIGILEYAYERIGISRQYVFSLLLLTLLGSYVNIPVAELPSEQVRSGEVITFFGMRYIVPFVKEWPRTMIAVNLGGAVIPFMLSVYLFVKGRLYMRSLIGVGIVTVVTHLLAHPVAGVGIAEPTFVPPLITAATALLLSRRYAPQIAYISGSLGTLIGADLLNLGKIQGMGAPVASIGGAGTFDGIFVTGILAVLLAGIMSPKAKSRMKSMP